MGPHWDSLKFLIEGLLPLVMLVQAVATDLLGAPGKWHSFSQVHIVQGKASGMAPLGFNLGHLPKSWAQDQRQCQPETHRKQRELKSLWKLLCYSTSSWAGQNFMSDWVLVVQCQAMCLHQSREATYIFPTKAVGFLSQRKKLFSLSLKFAKSLPSQGRGSLQRGFSFSHWALSIISVWGLPLDLICCSEGVPFLQLKWALLRTKTSMCVGKELTQIATTANGHCFAFQVTMTPDGKTQLCSGSP